MRMQNKIKNEMKVKIEEKNENENEIKKLIILVLIVTAIFFIFYGITILITKKDKTKVEPKEEVTHIDMNKILINQLLTQPEDNYYVLLTIENDSNNTTYESLKEEYYKKENHKKIYNANLNDPMNKTFLGDETKLEGELKEFKFEKSTLVEIENGSIKNKYIGSTEILSKLGEME